jgi:uncharacterized DUF497 family protein
MFSWDGLKAMTNRKKHGVPFEEAATVFADPTAWTGKTLNTQTRNRAGRDLLFPLRGVFCWSYIQCGG